MATEHAFSCLCNDSKYSVKESGRFDDPKQITPDLKCSQDDVAGSRIPSKPTYIYALPAHLK